MQQSAVFRRTAFENVGDVDVTAVNADGIQIFVKQLAGRADKRNARFILVLSRCFSDEHQAGIRIACSENDVGSGFAELAFLTCFAGSFDFIQ